MRLSRPCIPRRARFFRWSVRISVTWACSRLGCLAHLFKELPFSQSGTTIVTTIGTKRTAPRTAAPSSCSAAPVWSAPASAARARACGRGCASTRGPSSRPTASCCRHFASGTGPPGTRDISTRRSWVAGICSARSWPRPAASRGTSTILIRSSNSWAQGRPKLCDGPASAPSSRRRLRPPVLASGRRYGRRSLRTQLGRTRIGCPAVTVHMVRA
mmetsp:Transcript_11865/g.42446  ORF Transcript_11865/g.42446 Transcript_11865/m.42446 type:complete len:215 (-) Transcript_11865:973-1617(-)